MLGSTDDRGICLVTGGNDDSVNVGFVISAPKIVHQEMNTGVGTQTTACTCNSIGRH